MNTVYYFGALDKLGHRLYDHQCNVVYNLKNCPITDLQMDGMLLEELSIKDHPDGRVHWTKIQKNNTTWFCFVWWDRSMDMRQGSNSGFYIKTKDSDMQYTQAYRLVCDTFPQVIKRQKFNLNVVHKMGVIPE